MKSLAHILNEINRINQVQILDFTESIIKIVKENVGRI